MSAKQQPLPPKKRLDAIEWAANQRGMSYGKFVITLSEQDKRRIYDEYEAILEERTKKINAAIVSHKRVKTSTTCTLMHPPAPVLNPDRDCIKVTHQSHPFRRDSNPDGLS